MPLCRGAKAVRQTVRCGSGAEGPGVGGLDLLLHRNARRSGIWTGRAWKAPRFPALRFKKKKKRGQEEGRAARIPISLLQIQAGT